MNSPKKVGITETNGRKWILEREAKENMVIRDKFGGEK